MYESVGARVEKKTKIRKCVHAQKGFAFFIYHDDD